MEGPNVELMSKGINYLQAGVIGACINKQDLDFPAPFDQRWIGARQLAIADHCGKERLQIAKVGPRLVCHPPGRNCHDIRPLYLMATLGRPTSARLLLS